MSGEVIPESARGLSNLPWFPARWTLSQRVRAVLGVLLVMYAVHQIELAVIGALWMALLGLHWPTVLGGYAVIRLVQKGVAIHLEDALDVRDYRAYYLLAMRVAAYFLARVDGEDVCGMADGLGTSVPRGAKQMYAYTSVLTLMQAVGNRNERLFISHWAKHRGDLNGSAWNFVSSYGLLAQRFLRARKLPRSGYIYIHYQGLEQHQCDDAMGTSCIQSGLFGEHDDGAPTKHPADMKFPELLKHTVRCLELAFDKAPNEEFKLAIQVAGVLTAKLESSAATGKPIAVEINRVERPPPQPEAPPPPASS